MIIGSLTVGFIVLYLLAVKREKAIRKSITLEQELRDADIANDILAKSITRKPERVRRLDDAGFRD